MSSPSEDAPPVRTGGRVKKAKIVFDPSESNMPKKRSGRSTSYTEKTSDSPPRKVKKTKSNTSDQPPGDNKKSDITEEGNKNPTSDSCAICGKMEGKRGKKLISCKDCNYKVHPSCLKINFQNHNLLEEHWRCNSCTNCVVCYETSEAGVLVTCSVCVDSYHINCHAPKLNKTLNKFKWECNKCQNINNTVTIGKIPISVNHHENGDNNTKQGKDDRKDSSPRVAENSSIDNSPSAQCDKLKKESKLKETNSIAAITANDEEIPDIGDWSCDKVFKYIEKYFPREAHIFLEHEIDGASLLLMKRSDVIRGLSLKLGPALRLYSFIVRLQSKSNDPRLTWM